MVTVVTFCAVDVDVGVGVVEALAVPSFLAVTENVSTVPGPSSCSLTAAVLAALDPAIAPAPAAVPCANVCVVIRKTATASSLFIVTSKVV
jgi:hypothetical protein